MAGAERTTAIRLAIKGIEENRAFLKGLGEDGEKALQQIAANSNTASVALQKFDIAGQGVARVFRGNLFQQLGYQVGDFAVQVQGGTSVLTAFVQQGSQIAGAFGPAGAVVGALGAVIGGLVVYFSRTSEETDKAKEALDKLTQSTDQYKDAIKRLLPLQKSYLENQISIAAAQERAAAGPPPTTFSPEAARARQRTQTNPFGTTILPPGQTGLELPPPPLAGYFAGRSAPVAPGLEQARQRTIEAKKLIDLGDQIDAMFADTEAIDLYRDDFDELVKSWKEGDAAAERLAAEQKVAANAAKAHADAVANLTAALQEELAAAQRLNEGTAGGAYEQKLAEIEHAKQMRLLQIDKIKGTKEETDSLRQLAEETAHLRRVRASKDVPVPTDKGAATQRQAETESMVKLDEQQPQIDEARRNKAEAEAKKQYDILIEPWKDLAKEVGDITGDMFDQMLEKGKISFKDLATSISSIFRTTITGTIGNLVAQPLQTAIAGIGEAMTASQKGGQGFMAGAMDFAGKNKELVAGAAGAVGGYVAGTIYAQIAKLKPGNQAALGGAIGGAAGAVGGALLFPANPVIGAAVGGTLGGLAGSALGGLFGGENNLGNDRSAQVYGGRQRQIIYGDKSFSDENRAVTQGVLEQVRQLQMGLESLGGTFKKFELRLEAGNKTGITVNGVKYENAQDALVASIEFLLGKQTGGLTETQAQILKTTKAETAPEILADVGFAKTYDALVAGGNQFDQQLQDLNETFAAATIKAKELKLDTAALAAAQATAAAEIARQRDQAVRGVYQQLAQVSGDTTLSTQMHVLETDMRELAKAAMDLGIPLEMVTRAHQLAAQEIVRARDQMVRGIYGQLAALSTGNDLTTQLFNLETQMRELAVSAAAAGIPIEQVTAAHQAAAQQLIKEDAERQQQEREKAQADAERRRQEAEQAREDQFRRNQDIRGVWSQFAALRGDNSLPQQLFNLGTQMTELAHVAGKLGIPIKNVSQAWQLAADALIRQNTENVRKFYSQLGDIAGDESLRMALFGLQTQFTDLYQAAGELGVPLQRVTSVYGTAIRQLTETYDKAIRDLQKQQGALDQSLIDANRSAFQVIDGFLEPLKQATGAFGIGQGVFSQAATAKGGLEEFRKVLQLAQGGDTGALSSLVGVGQQALQASRAYGASGSEFAAAFREVNQGLLGVQGELEAKRMTLAQQAVDYGRETVNELIRLRVETIRELQEQREQLRRDLAIAIERRAA